MLILPSHEGGRLSRPRHYSKGAQPIPKAVYRSGCRDKHNRPRCDSNLGPLAPQSDALTARPLRPEQAQGLLTEYLIETFDVYYFFYFHRRCVYLQTLRAATISDQLASTLVRQSTRSTYRGIITSDNYLMSSLFYLGLYLLANLPKMPTKLLGSSSKLSRFLKFASFTVSPPHIVTLVAHFKISNQIYIEPAQHDCNLSHLNDWLLQFMSQ